MKNKVKEIFKDWESFSFYFIIVFLVVYLSYCFISAFIFPDFDEFFSYDPYPERTAYNTAVRKDVNQLQENYVTNLNIVAKYLDEKPDLENSDEIEAYRNFCDSMVQIAQKAQNKKHIRQFYLHSTKPYFIPGFRSKLKEECEVSRDEIEDLLVQINSWEYDHFSGDLPSPVLLYGAAARAYIYKAAEYVTSPKSLSQNGRIGYEANASQRLDSYYGHGNDSTCRRRSLGSYLTVTTGQLQMCSELMNILVSDMG